MPSPSPIGVVIRDLRQARGYNKAELARKAGIDPSYVSQLELGLRRNVSYEIAGNIAEALGISPTELYARAGQLGSGPVAPLDPAPDPEKEAILRRLARQPAGVLRKVEDFIVFLTSQAYQIEADSEPGQPATEQPGAKRQEEQQEQRRRPPQ